MKVKVFEFIPVISEGGAETLVRDYCLLLKNSEFELVVVTVLPSDPCSSNYQTLLSNGVKILSLNKKHWADYNKIIRVFWRFTFFPLFSAYRFRKIIKQENPQCIHAHLNVLEYLPFIHRTLKGIKLFFTCHSKPDIVFNKKYNLKQYLSAKFLIKHNSLRLIALHTLMCNQLNELFNINNTLVVHNGIDFKRFSNLDSEKYSTKKSLDIDQNTFVVGHIGRFAPVKNHRFIVELFKRLYSIRTDTHLLLIGDGPLYKEISDLINSLGLSKNVTILSHRKDIPRLLKCMDVFLLPSLYEGLPVSLVEAQVANVRCLVSDCITSECFFSENVVPLSLDDVDSWVTAILDSSVKGQYTGDISSFDMNNEIIKLANLYSSNI